MIYYNENDPTNVWWLRELIKQRVIPAGNVDGRDIQEIRPYELARYHQQHFFAGIGGWAFALRLAGWPEDRPVRTGSCPCQPFSQSGKRLGQNDKRHLWPVFRDLITFGESTVTFGEQVASPLGREWLAGVRTDLEGLGYEVGAADLCAACVGAPHIRQRLYWVAKPLRSNVLFRSEAKQQAKSVGRSTACRLGQHGDTALPAGGNVWLGDSDSERRQIRAGHSGNDAEEIRTERGQATVQTGAWSNYAIVQCSDGKARRFEPGSQCLADGLSKSLADRWNESFENIKKEIIVYAESKKTRPGEVLLALQESLNPHFLQWCAGGSVCFQTEAVLFTALCELSRELGSVTNSQTPGSTQELWFNMPGVRQSKKSSGSSCGPGFSEQCTGQLGDIVRELSQEVAPIAGDIAPMIIHSFPLSRTVPGRVGLLRGYGNAIVPQLAAEFIRASLETHK